MGTEAQIAANRENALKGGPKTSEGKLISSQNAIKHGLLAQNILIKSERAQDLDAFRHAISVDLSPMGTMEELLVEKTIAAAWRLQRLAKVESEMFNDGEMFSRNKGLQLAFDGSSEQLLTLMRYESTLEKAFYKALHELQRLQGMRLGQTVLAPIAIELNGEGP